MQLNEVTGNAGIEKGWEKGKKGGAGNALLSHFPFRFPPSLLPLPFFCACHPGYFEDGAAEGLEHRHPNLAI